MTMTALHPNSRAVTSRGAPRWSHSPPSGAPPPLPHPLVGLSTLSCGVLGAAVFLPLGLLLRRARAPKQAPLFT